MGCVYFFKHNNSKYVKIGMSCKDTPDERFASFSTYAPMGGEILGYFRTPDPSYYERKIHSELKDKRMYGEWFDIDYSDVEPFILKYNQISAVKRLMFDIPFDLDDEHRNYKYLRILEIFYRRAYLNILNVEIDYLLKIISFEKDNVDISDIDLVGVYNNHFLKK